MSHRMLSHRSRRFTSAHIAKHFLIILSVLLGSSIAFTAMASEPGAPHQDNPSQMAEVTTVTPNALSKARVITEALASGQDPMPSTPPSFVDHSLSIHFPPIKGQTAGDCTCYSSTYYYNTFLQASDEDLDAATPDPYTGLGDPDVINSPRFTMVLISEDCWGALGTRTAMERLADSGASNVTEFDYEEPLGWGAPFPYESAWVYALRNRTGTMHSLRVDTPEGLIAMKQAIANGSCVVTRADFGGNYVDYRDNAAGYGIDNHVMFTRLMDYHGCRHSICICGYDDNKAYFDNRAGIMETRYGAFLIANSEGQDKDWYNSTGTGTKGFMWVAYTMFTERQLGYYNWPEPMGVDPCYDNEDDPTVYYHDDRPNYRPKLYAVVGVNHAKRNKIILTGGIGDTTLPDFMGPEAIKETDYGEVAIDDSRCVAVDLTDGTNMLVPGTPTQVFVKLTVVDGAGSNGTITSADFYYDPEGDGTYSIFSSSDPTVTVTPNHSDFATVMISAPLPLYVDDSNTTGPWDGSPEHPYQTIQAGLDAISPNNTLYVLPGTYNEAVLITKSVTLVSTGGADVTTINASDGGEAVLVSGVSMALIEGFTLISGPTYTALRSTDATTTVRHCIATDSKNGFGVGQTGSMDLINCLSYDNDKHGAWQSISAPLTIRNSTITGNAENGIIRWGSGMVILTDSIVYGNVDDIDGTPTGFDVSTSCIGDGDFAGSNGNFSADPLFVTGYVHDYYLSQTAAGQGSDSPCVDVGSTTASALGLDDRTTRTDGANDTGLVDLGYHATQPLWIMDVYWDQPTTSVVVSFLSEVGVEYTVETADAAEYSDSLVWSNWTTPTASTTLTTVTDNLTTQPLTAAFRFYRVKRSDGTAVSRQTVAVFEQSLAASPALKFTSIPLIPDADHATVREIFGEGTARQIPRNGFQVSDMNEATGQVSRLRLNLSGTFDLITGSEFDLAPCAGYELFMGFGPPLSYTLRLTGYVPEDSLSMDLTKTGTQALRWTAYSMPRATTLASLGLETAATPWSSLNRVRLLPPGTSVWANYRYDSTGGYWYAESAPGVPADPPLSCGQGFVFQRFGPPDLSDALTLDKWYTAPPNE